MGARRPWPSGPLGDPTVPTVPPEVQRWCSAGNRGLGTGNNTWHRAPSVLSAEPTYTLHDGELQRQKELGTDGSRCNLAADEIGMHGRMSWPSDSARGHRHRPRPPRPRGGAAARQGRRGGPFLSVLFRSRWILSGGHSSWPSSAQRTQHTPTHALCVHTYKYPRANRHAMATSQQTP